MIDFNTHHLSNKNCYIIPYYDMAIRYAHPDNLFIIIDEKYLQITKIRNNLGIYGDYRYIDFSELNNNFKELEIKCRKLRCLYIPHNIYNNISIYIDKFLKYLDILNIQQVDISYIYECRFINNLNIIKCRYIIIKKYFKNIKEKYIYITILKASIMM